MPPKKDNSTKTFSFDEVAALLAASNVTIGASCYKVMAKVYQSRTESGYEHLFRDVKIRAKEIRKMIDNGELGGLAAKSPAKRSNSSPSADGQKGKGGTKRGKFSLP